jgi:putative membrane protein
MKNANNAIVVVILAAGCLRVGLAGCAEPLATPPAAGPASHDRTEVTLTSAPVAVPEGTLSDGQIVGIAFAIDRAEIAAGNRASSHASNAQTRQFAAHMVQAHSTMDAKLASLAGSRGIAAAESALCEKLKSDNQALGEQLTQMSGVQFDRAYIDAQLKGHKDVLDLLDTKLIPLAQDPSLKAGLEDTRARVVDHIQMAEQARASLGP